MVPLGGDEPRARSASPTLRVSPFLLDIFVRQMMTRPFGRVPDVRPASPDGRRRGGSRGSGGRRRRPRAERQCHRVSVSQPPAAPVAPAGVSLSAAPSMAVERSTPQYAWPGAAGRRAKRPVPTPTSRKRAPEPAPTRARTASRTRSATPSGSASSHRANATAARSKFTPGTSRSALSREPDSGHTSYIMRPAPLRGRRLTWLSTPARAGRIGPPSGNSERVRRLDAREAENAFSGRRTAMSWNGHPVIDLDSHIVERADRFYHDYMDPVYRDAYQQLCDAVARQAEAGNGYLFSHRRHRAHRGWADLRPPRHLWVRPAVEHGRRTQKPPARPGGCPPADPARGLGRQASTARGHGPGSGGRSSQPTHVSG